MQNANMNAPHLTTCLEQPEILLVLRIWRRGERSATSVSPEQHKCLKNAKISNIYKTTYIICAAPAQRKKLDAREFFGRQLRSRQMMTSFPAAGLRKVDVPLKD